MAKKRVDLKLTPVNQNKLSKALDDLAPHVAKAVEAWPLMTQQQREAFYANNPILARLISMTEGFRNG